MRTCKLSSGWILCCLFFLLFSTTALAQPNASEWTGTWSARSEQGDASYTLEMNCSQTSPLNPYNEESLCNGFISINAKEPNGSFSLLATYELTLTNLDGNTAYFNYAPGRPGMDDGEGTCKAVMDNGKLTFTGSDAMFNQVSFYREGSSQAITSMSNNSGAVDESNTESIPYGDMPSEEPEQKSWWEEITATGIITTILFLIMIVHMAYTWYKGKRFKIVYRT